MRRAGAALLPLLAALLITLPAATAAAANLSAGEARELAATAGGDPAALERLQTATSIDGVPAEPGRALGDATGDDLDRRLAALERSLGEPGASAADADAAREQAAAIIDGFPDEEGQQPGTITGSSGDGVSLDVGALWIPLLIAAVVAGAVLATRLARNRERSGRLAAEADSAAGEQPLGELELRAGRAEQDGDWAEALRLRYGVALRELQRSGVIAPHPSVTPARVSRELGDPRAAELVGTFEHVVYGGRAAAEEDARAAREGWPAVVAGRAAAATGRGEGRG